MHKIFRVKKVIRETPNAVSIIFKGRIEYKPGQFILLWLPRIGEKPFAISYYEKEEFGVTVEEKGEFTKKVSKIKVGARLGIRGPYGHGFEIKKGKSIIVAGGLGMAPALPLIKKIRNSVIIQGAKSKDFLLYRMNKELLETMEKQKNRIIYCTDDGSFGIKGFVTDILAEIIKKDVQVVYTCGPEVMIKKVFDICEKKNVECQASLERFIKCGIGVCGSCVINGQLVCKDGPVFSSIQLRKLKELGKFARAKSGKKVSIKEYFNYKK